MEIKQAYKILGIPADAQLDQVKKAYRQKAFQYHPDLNPDKPEAVAKFQQINRAYVLLKEVSLEKPGFGPRQSKTTGAQNRKQSKKEKSRQEKDASGFQRGAHRQRFHYQQEEVLRDILNDPFAKKVFEDIFVRVKKQKTTGLELAEKKKQFSLQWGERRLDLDLSHGIFGGLKKWFSSQLDDEQTVYLTPHKMLPGSEIRIRIGRKLGNKSQTINVTIPQDYVAGRPIRLKKLGRSLGPWQGDLYLRLLAR